MKYVNILPSTNTEVASDFEVKPEENQVTICFEQPFYSMVERGNALFWIDSYVLMDVFLNNEKEFDKLIRVANDIFTIENVEPLEKAARNEIAKIKDRSIDAISNKHTGELERIINLYLDLIEEFYKYFQVYGGGFTNEQAEMERNSFTDRLKPVEWISKDIREVFERGMESEDKIIIREVSYLPIKLLNRAIEYNDHLIFQEFSYFPQLLYDYALKMEREDKKNISNFLLDRSWRYLDETSKFYLERLLEENKLSLEEFKSFAVDILKIFQELLKMSLNQKDEKNFRIFLKRSSKLFKQIYLHEYNVERKKINDLEKFIKKKKEEIFFWLASWVLHLWCNDQSDDELKGNNKDRYKNYYRETIKYIPHNIIEVTKLFLDTHKYETEDFWKWDLWEELYSYEEGEAHILNIQGKIEKFYIIHSLEILKEKNDMTIRNIELPYNMDFKYLVDSSGPLIKLLDEIKINKAEWSFVLSMNAYKKIDSLKHILIKAGEKQNKILLKAKREKPISEKKVGEFKNALIENFYESCILRNVFTEQGLFINKIEENVDNIIARFEINTMFDKAAFFDNWHIRFSGSQGAFGFGESIADRETIYIINKIRNSCAIINENNLFEKINLLKDESNLLILAVNDNALAFLECNNDLFISKWKSIFPKKYRNERLIEGVIKTNRKIIPIYYVRMSDRQGGIFILNKDRLGKLIQYSPLQDGDNIKLKKDIFLVDVVDFTKTEDINEIKKIIGNPEWLEKIGDRYEQLNYVKERVLIKILESFKFELDDKFEGYYLKIENDK